MEENYGVMAMSLYSELLERVNQLEKDFIKSSVSKIVYDDNIKILGDSIDKDYVLTTKSTCSAKVKIIVKNLTGKFRIEVFVNGEKKNEWQFNDDKEEYFDEIILKKGKNSLLIKYVQVGDDYCFFTPVVTVEGCVKSVIDAKRISVAKKIGPFGNNYFFTFISGEVLEYHFFSGEAGDNVYFTINGVKSATIVTLNNSNYVFYLTLSGKLKCIKSIGREYEDINIPEIYGADIAGYSSANVIKLFIVKFGEVFVADFNGTNELNFIKSGIKARRVYSENNVKCLIATSEDLPSNLIIAERFPINGNEYYSVKLPKGENYHVYESEVGYEIVYSQNAVIKKITVNSGVNSKAETLTDGDEMIKTDNSVLIRRGQNLKEVLNYKFKL